MYSFFFKLIDYIFTKREAILKNFKANEET